MYFPKKTLFMKHTFLVLIILLVSLQVIHAQKVVLKKSWQQFYDKYNVVGTTVVLNVKTNELKVLNIERSDSAFLPASTFKILNSLIALQTGAVKSVDDTIVWDGVDRHWDKWNRDHTMRTAMPVSCIWFYQELARRIGIEDMRKWVDSADYGNKLLGSEVDRFWLDGDIRISANQQIAFILKLVTDELPFDIDIQRRVKEIMITDSTQSYIVHSKTGWVKGAKKQIGWFVGYVETNKSKWIFATNIIINSKKQASYRKKITYDILNYEGII